MRGLAIIFFSDWLDDGSATGTLLAADAKDEEKRRLREQSKSLPASGSGKRKSIRDLPMIGMWKDREDMKDPVAWVREIRKPRFRA